MRIAHKIKFLLLLASPAIILYTSLQAQDAITSASVKRTIIVRGDHYYPPYEFINKNGEPDGFNVELFKAIAKELGLTYELELGPWGQVREELENGKIDLLLGLMVSPQRAEKMHFGVPHSVMTHGIFTHKDKSFRTLEELRDKEIIVQDKDRMHDYLLESGLTDKIIAVGTQLDALLLLENGQHDAALLGNFQGSHLTKENKLRNVRIRTSDIDPQKYAMAVNLDRIELLWILNQGLYQMKVSGVYDELYEKWFAVHDRNYFIRKYSIALIISVGIALLLLAFNLLLRMRVKVATRKLSESEEKYRLLINNQNDLIVKVGPLGHFLFVSPSYCRLFGKSEAELLGKKFMPLVHEEDRESTARAMEGLQRPPHIAYVEQRALTIHGWRWIAWSDTAIIGPDNKIKEIIGTGRDITDRKQSEAELQKAKIRAEESDRLKTAFLNNMSHEIRTPLNGILGFTELLNNPDTSPQKRDYYSRIINQSSLQLLSIIDDIINIATIEAGQEKLRESISDVNLLMKSIYEQLRSKAEAKQLAFNYHSEISNKDQKILCDGTKLSQVLANLVSNAIKFTDDGNVEFGCRLEGNYLHFHVNDTGIGIPADYQDAIFERFRQVNNDNTRDYSGNGLGLAISKAYVELMGGRIWVESAPEKGSKFHFTILNKTLTASTPKEISAEKTQHPAKPSDTKTILLAEDEYSNYMLVEVILQPLDYNVIHVDDGLKAVEAIRSKQDICLVLMDIKMPGMNGLDAARIIKKEKPDIPVIALTAYALEGDRETALAAGCDGYIAKPFGKEELIQIIQKHLT